MADSLLSKERCATMTAGAAATLAMMGASRLARSRVMPELEELAATAVARPGSEAGEAVGVGTQLLNGALFAEIYRTAFESLHIKPSWRSGAAIGLAHGVVAGLFLGAVPPLHPRVPEEVPAPGAFMRHRGFEAVAMLLGLHAFYGAIVGSAIAAVSQIDVELRAAS